MLHGSARTFLSPARSDWPTTVGEVPSSSAFCAGTISQDQPVSQRPLAALDLSYALWNRDCDDCKALPYAGVSKPDPHWGPSRISIDFGYPDDHLMVLQKISLL